MTSRWQIYEPGGDGYLPPKVWGRDHWSTLAYAESVAVDHRGVLDNRRMRTDPRLHREFAANYMQAGRMGDGSRSPTRLADGTEHDGRHDDWSCLEDMAAHGLLTLEWKRVDQAAQFNNSVARVTMTAKGLATVMYLRNHKSNGGTFADFKYRRWPITFSAWAILIMAAAL